jgi:hypothetical protein
MIKKFLAVLLVSGSISSCAELGNIASNIPSTITEAEAAQGIREALVQGVDHGVSFLNKTVFLVTRPISYYCRQMHNVLKIHFAS